MKEKLPIKDGTDNKFDYIKFLEVLLEDLRNVLSKVSKKFQEDFKLTMGLNNEER